MLKTILRTWLLAIAFCGALSLAPVGAETPISHRGGMTIFFVEPSWKDEDLLKRLMADEKAVRSYVIAITTAYRAEEDWRNSPLRAREEGGPIWLLTKSKWSPGGWQSYIAEAAESQNPGRKKPGMPTAPTQFIFGRLVRAVTTAVEDLADHDPEFINLSSPKHVPVDVVFLFDRTLQLRADNNDSGIDSGSTCLRENSVAPSGLQTAYRGAENASKWMAAAIDAARNRGLILDIRVYFGHSPTDLPDAPRQWNTLDYYNALFGFGFKSSTVRDKLPGFSAALFDTECFSEKKEALRSLPFGPLQPFALDNFEAMPILCTKNPPTLPSHGFNCESQSDRAAIDIVTGAIEPDRPPPPPPPRSRSVGVVFAATPDNLEGKYRLFVDVDPSCQVRASVDLRYSATPTSAPATLPETPTILEFQQGQKMPANMKYVYAHVTPISGCARDGFALKLRVSGSDVDPSSRGVLSIAGDPGACDAVDVEVAHAPDTSIGLYKVVVSGNDSGATTAKDCPIGR